MICAVCRTFLWEESTADERIGGREIALDCQGSESPLRAIYGKEGDVVEGRVLDDDGGVDVSWALETHLRAEAAR